jgi:hypothetical protein
MWEESVLKQISSKEDRKVAGESNSATTTDMNRCLKVTIKITRNRNHIFMPVVETPETLDIFVTKCHTFEQRISQINTVTR